MHFSVKIALFRPLPLPLPYPYPTPMGYMKTGEKGKGGVRQMWGNGGQMGLFMMIFDAF